MNYQSGVLASIISEYTNLNQSSRIVHKKLAANQPDPKFEEVVPAPLPSVLKARERFKAKLEQAGE